ncbi:hypothetical protein D9615_007833 [Tricholomella constricta]|uniref:Uncharacterized protein n=1 Tax=Tricholomella constricta TaxID=117010 RepID=A0A8H5GWJ6_9AGAR|nr:hypothetical protein D9615_009297 [Tricholomella constricta]KAF5376661.1 hypothetical protein D9615_007833 [Tricholomella constricta]
MAPRTMAEMMDMHLDSSPIQPSARSSSPQQSPSSSPSPTPAGHQTEGSILPLPNLSASHRKRPADSDMTQYAQEVGRSTKLLKGDQERLEKFSKLDHSEQRIWIAGHILKLGEQQSALQPPDILYIIPKKLEAKIDKLSATTLLNPLIAAYVHTKHGPTNILVDCLEENPSWGLTKAVRSDSIKFEVIHGHIQKKLTAVRYSIKKTIQAACGKPDPDDVTGTRQLGATDIVELCKTLISSNKHMDQVVDLPMCARIAFLRKIITEDPSGKYWESVDSQLDRARAKYTDAKKLSRFFAMILDEDCKIYGKANLDGLVTSATRARTSQDLSAVDGEAD